MIKNYVIALIIIISFISCGKSEEEIALEKAKIELEKTKIELAEKTKAAEELKISEEKAEKERIHQQRRNVGKTKKHTGLTSKLQQLNESKKNVENKLKEINKFKLGRSSSTKSKQLEEAQMQLSEVYNMKRKVENEIAQLEHFKTFDFQKNPIDVISFIFESIKNEDYSEFRNLCDPYGENDNDVNYFCYAEMLTKKMQNNLKRDFENARIIGEPKIVGDKAEVEIAFGRSTNQLEKIRLVKRNGLWYLFSF